MSWKEWFGFTEPRDAPDTELPRIEDNVRDSGGVFVFGMTNSGELVNEKSALQISTVYACVRLLRGVCLSVKDHVAGGIVTASLWSFSLHETGT